MDAAGIKRVILASNCCNRKIQLKQAGRLADRRPVSAATEAMAAVIVEATVENINRQIA